ncbi:MAG: mycofactocin precursor MftA [Mycobacteriales bacterium]
MSAPLAPPLETQTVPQAGTDADRADEAADELVLADLLVEDISIDGMCGVY